MATAPSTIHTMSIEELREEAALHVNLLRSEPTNRSSSRRLAYLLETIIKHEFPDFSLVWRRYKHKGNTNTEAMLEFFRGQGAPIKGWTEEGWGSASKTSDVTDADEKSDAAPLPTIKLDLQAELKTLMAKLEAEYELKLSELEEIQAAMNALMTTIKLVAGTGRED